MKRGRSAPSAAASAALASATLIARVLTVVSVLAMGEARAQVAGGASGPSATSAAASPVFGLMQGLVGLVIVIGLIFAAGWLMKKVGPRTRTAGIVQVVGGASVGPREKVVVVRFDGQTLLLGVAPGQVSLLHTAHAVDAVDEPAPAANTAPRFIDRLRAARSGS